MSLLYRLFAAIAALLLAPYYAVRARRRGEPAGRAWERMGYVPADIRGRARRAQGPTIWLHAVSVGETLAAIPVVDALKDRLPDSVIFVSTTTETGQALARERLKQADGFFYFPFDSAGAARRALRSIRPAAVVIMETEIWPNFLRESQRAGAPVVFANARISERSFARFARWRFLVGSLFEESLARAGRFLVQSPRDEARLKEMGASEEQVVVTGNLKYDVGPPTPGAFATWLGEQIRNQERWPVLVAGSVLALEEEAIVAAYDVVQRKYRRALLVLAPRKPDRFGAAAEAAAAAGWKAIRRSQINMDAPLDEAADVLVLDSVGELAGVYSVADAVFVGGSLVDGGGHNILEPAWFAKPPVFGRSMENFRDMAAQFLDANAAVQVNSGPQLGKAWLQMVENVSLRDKMGRAALELSRHNRGATECAVAQIIGVLKEREAAG